MATSERDLWPSDINVLPNISTPVSLLREQATLLGEKTYGLVEAEVRSGGDKDEDKYSQFIHTFYLVAPALDNYRHKLFTVTHKVELYPLTIRFSNQDFLANDSAQFTECLKKIFADEKTKSVIQAFIAQSRT